MKMLIVGHHSNQRRGSGNMDTGFMDVQNVGQHSNQRRSSGNIGTEYMEEWDVGLYFVVLFL
jgi:hypothetical protein